MKSTYAGLMQSKYFNPAFNSALFDGPVRIYFAQMHESQALKIYFLLQKELSHEWARAKEVTRQTGANVLILIYPSEETFALSFESEVEDEIFVQESWNQELVYGVNGPLDDTQVEEFLKQLKSSLMKWHPHIQAPLENPASL
jgi:hypothetical protein